MTRAAASPLGWRSAAIVAAIAAAALALVPALAGDFTLHMLTTSCYYTILAASWNLLAGFTGQFSLAHQAFAAIGAYTSGLLIRYFAVPIWFGITSGVLVAALFGYGLGRMVLSMRAIYLAIATWAFA
ncbi:MAG TPA: branched-chain amino acid ABC transporter permease, partial [Xanthobacteraceae bacterium]|nr:branched-chain amino acid ABC transporter permease [Xanthobacteraceae bacterium]